MKLSKRISLVAVLFICANLISSVTLFSPTVEAASRAETYCAKKYKKDNDKKEACKKGFSAGYDRKDSKECDSETGESKDACKDGFKNGKSKRTSEIKDDAEKGAQEKKSKREACNIRNADDKKTCEKAYDDEVKAMAAKAGKEAGSSGQPSPCGTVFGGDKARASCKKAYDKAVAAAQKAKDEAGINNCAGVATYFKFNCSGASADAGGNKNPIIKLGLSILGWITTIVAVAVIGGIVYGGFLYMTAEDKSSQTQKGVTIIVDSIIALILWVFAYIVINFLVPGGLFN